MPGEGKNVRDVNKGMMHGEKCEKEWDLAIKKRRYKMDWMGKDSMQCHPHQRKAGRNDGREAQW